MGVIKRRGNYGISSTGNVYSYFGKRRKLKPRLCGKYLGVAIGGKNYHVHRLVLEWFVGPCPEGMEACHNDGDSTNNRLDNLRWDTRKANIIDSVKHGTHYTGKGTMLTREQVKKIRAKKGTATQAEIGAQFGVTQQTISKIMNGKLWAHV